MHMPPLSTDGVPVWYAKNRASLVTGGLKEFQRRITGAVFSHHPKCCELLLQYECDFCSTLSKTVSEDKKISTFDSREALRHEAFMNAMKEGIRRNGNISPAVASIFVKYALSLEPTFGRETLVELFTVQVESSSWPSAGVKMFIDVCIEAGMSRSSVVDVFVRRRRAQRASGNLLHLVAKLGRVDHLAVVLDFIEDVEGEDGTPTLKPILTLRDRKGHTPLMAAVLAPSSSSALGLVRLLTARGADTAALAKDGSNLFQLASRLSNHRWLLRTLCVDFHVDPNYRRPGDEATALHLWSQGKRMNMDVLRAIIAAGCDASSTTRSRRFRRVGDGETVSAVEILMRRLLSTGIWNLDLYRRHRMHTFWSACKPLYVAGADNHQFEKDMINTYTYSNMSFPGIRTIASTVCSEFLAMLLFGEGGE